MSKIIDIAIIGTGLAGLATALNLANQGYNITVFSHGEAKPLSSPYRTTTINQMSYRVLKKMGMVDEIKAAGHSLTEIHEIKVSDKKMTHDHGTIMNWQRTNPSEPIAWVFRNIHLETVMLKACQEHPHISISTNKTIVNYTPHHPELGTAAAAFFDDSGYVYAARLIVAGDGKNSLLRQAANIKTINRKPNQTAIVADIVTTIPHRNIAWQRFSDNHIIALMPCDTCCGDNNMEGHLMSVVWTMPDKDAQYLLNIDDDAFNQTCTSRFGTAFGDLRLNSPRSSWKLQLCHAVKPYATRLALIGDAAHTIHPLAGQGYNLALSDANTLTQVIKTTQQNGIDIGSKTVLKNYALKRFPEIASMTLATDGINMLFGNAKTAAFASSAMTILNRTPFKKFASTIANGRYIKHD